MEKAPLSSSHRLSRRRFLETSGVLVTSGLLAACGSEASTPTPIAPPVLSAKPEERPTVTPSPRAIERPVALPSPTEIPKPIPSPAKPSPTPIPEVEMNLPTFKDHVNATTQLKDPTMRAAAILFISRIDERSLRLGHGGLFMGDSKRPYILTARHVADGGVTGVQLLIPGLGFTERKIIKWQGFPLKRNDKRTDAEVAYFFEDDPDLAARIRSMIATGDINPLKETINLDAQGYKAATLTPGKSTLTNLTPYEYHAPTNMLVMLIDNNRICRGNSGQPVLMTERGIPTSKSVGLVSAAPLSNGETCTDAAVFVRPHN